MSLRTITTRITVAVAMLLAFPLWGQQLEGDAADTEAQAQAIHGVGDATEAVAENQSDETLEDLDITALMEIEVVSVSGSDNSWFTTPAALTVITAQDIERGGFQLLPETLRMVPGMNVGRLNASQWAIGSRGFNSLFANKLQVSVDGRSAYNLIFGGVVWNEVDMILPDLEQIEVVRGPGATLWGTNAVNGVINIRSKSAEDTQGWLITGGIGTELQGIAQARYGGELGEDTFFRVWTKYVDHDSGVNASGADRPDDADFLRGGFRLDGNTSENPWTLQGDLFYSNRQGNASLIPQNTGHLATLLTIGDTDALAGNLLGRIHIDHGEHGWSEFQSYFDARHLTVINGLDAQTYTLNNEYRRQFAVGRHDILFGLGYRYDILNTTPSATLGYNPARRELHQFRGFIQDTITFDDERWSLLIGSKFEHNDFTSFEYQPSARLSFAPDDSTLYWGAVSRAIRTPNSSTEDLSLVLAFVDTGLAGGGPASGIIVPSTLTGSPTIDSEELLAFELGYRKQLSESLLLDIATYYNNYDDIVVIPTGTITPVQTNSSGTIHTVGGEISLNWSPSEVFDVVGSYSYYESYFSRAASFTNNPPASYPQHMAQVRTSYEVKKGLDLSVNAYAVSNSGGLGGSGYVRLDAGIVWQIDSRTKLSIWGQNLLDDAHVEATDSFLLDAPTEIERGVTATLTREF